jgi:hypothetical protein
MLALTAAVAAVPRTTTNGPALRPLLADGEPTGRGHIIGIEATSKLQMDCRGRDGRAMPCSRYDDWFDRAPVTGTCIPERQKASQLHQDMQALEFLKCKKNGYYVDIGANDGRLISNTFVMDTVFSWRGLCIEPFPSNMEQRNCTVLRKVVSNATGQEVKFEHEGGEDSRDVLGGMEDTIDPDDRHDQESTVYNFTTVTVTELLDNRHAPAVVDFVSIDVGSWLKVMLLALSKAHGATRVLCPEARASLFSRKRSTAWQHARRIRLRRTQVAAY